MASVSGLSYKNRLSARSRAVKAAKLAQAHEPEVHYTQGPRRWDGINQGLNSNKGQYPKHADCSAFATWCLWNGLFLQYGVRDTVNDTNWRSGFTGTQLQHGKEVKRRINVRAGDLVLYGVPGTSGKHVAIVVGRNKLGKIMVVSHGSEGGPFYINYDYRSDIMCIRRYI